MANPQRKDYSTFNLEGKKYSKEDLEKSGYFDLDDLLDDDEQVAETKPEILEDSTASVIPFPIKSSELTPGPKAPSDDAVTAPVHKPPASVDSESLRGHLAPVVSAPEPVAASVMRVASTHKDKHQSTPPGLRARKFIDYDGKHPKARGKKAKYAPEETEDTIERQMDTYAWYNQTGVKLKPQDNFADLIGDDGLIDMEAALKFSENGRLNWEQKAEILGLSDFEQVQGWIRSKSIKDKCLKAKDHAADVKVKLINLSKKPRKNDIDFSASIPVWTLIAHAEHLAKGFSEAKRLQIFEWLGGKAISRQTFSSYLGKINKRLAQCK